MKKLVLKFNERVGKSPLAKVEELAKNLGLRIESGPEGKPGQRTIHVLGHSDKLHEMDRALVRYASISRKAA